MPRKKLRMKATTTCITAEQDDKIRILSKVTNTPIAVYIRQGIDLALAKHGMRKEKESR